MTSPPSNRKNRKLNRLKRPRTVPHRRANVKKQLQNKTRRRGAVSPTNKPVPFIKDKDGQILKKQTQLDAMRLLTVWAADDTLRPLLAVGRVLEAALLITGGRQRQLEALDNDGKGRPLTMGRPKYVGTELQIAANRLLLTFTQADFEAMESADRRQAIDHYAKEADEKLTSFLLPSRFIAMSPTTSSSTTSSPITLPTTSSSLPPKNVFGRASEPPVPISVLDMRGAPLAADGDRSKRSHGDHIAVWEVFRKGMMNAEVRGRIRQLWRDEIEFRSILDERDHRLDGAITHARKLNLQYSEKKVRLNRLARIEQLCSPEGRMKEARKIHGLDWQNPSHLWGGDSRVRRRLLGLEPAEPVRDSHVHHHHPPAIEPAPEPEPVPIVQPDYFGRCADTGGRAWWENLVVKKKRPTREELALLPYDISKDMEEVEQIITPMFQPQEDQEKVPATFNEIDISIPDSVENEENEVAVQFIPVLRPSTAPDTTGSLNMFAGNTGAYHVGRPMTSGHN